MTFASNQESSPIKIDAIDALRGWAILSVLANHTNVISPASEYINTLLQQGVRGVQLFFIISSFTLFLSWNKRKLIEKSPIRNYLLRRFFRIAPLFYPVLLFWLMYMGTKANEYAPNGINTITIALTFLFLNGFHVETLQAIFPGGWTIAVEMSFYILLIYLFYKIKDLNSAIKYGSILAIFGLAISIAGFYLAKNFYSGATLTVAHGYFGNFWLPIQLTPFMVGIVLYYLSCSNYDCIVSATTLLVISLIGIVTLAYINLPLKLLFYTPFLFLFSYSLLSAKKNTFPLAIFNNSITRFIGKISYSMYLIHFIVIIYFERYISNTIPSHLNKNGLLVFIIIFIISGLISSVTYFFIEKPTQEIGKKIITYLEKTHD